MSRQDLEVIIPCGNNSDKYVANFVKTALETCSDDTDLTFSIGINNFPQFDLNCLNFAKQYAKINFKVVDTNLAPGSQGHAIVLQSLFDDVKSENCLISDCDIVMLHKNWDTIMFSHLNENVVIVGTDYFPFSNLPKYVGFPALIVVLFKTSMIKENNLSFMPHPNPGAHIIKTQEESFAYNRPIGHKIYLDVGYEFPLKLKPKNLDGYCFQMVKSGKLQIGQEFHYKGNPIINHMKGSSCIHSSQQHAQNWFVSANNWNEMTKQKNRIIPIH